jgi:hypothetical protein
MTSIMHIIVTWSTMPTNRVMVFIRLKGSCKVYPLGLSLEIIKVDESVKR